MKTSYTFLITILLITTSFTQTNIPPGDVSGTWTLSGSPYNVTGDITISNGETLIIEPGVTVNFQGFYIFAVQGRLLAIGTQTDSIRFTSSNTTEGWRGIRFINTPATNDTSKFYYCSIRHGKNNSGTGDNPLGGGMFIRNFSKVHISHCYFSDNSARWGGAIQVRENTHILIEHSTFTNNYAEFSGAGIRAIDFSDPVIRFNKLYNNSVGSGGAAMYFYRSNALVMNNHIYNNTSTSSGGAASLDNSMPTFINNLIVNNTSVNGGALHFTTLSNAKIINNTFTGNSATNGGALYFSLSSNPDFINNIFWGNTAPFGSQVYIANDNSDPNFYHCIVQDGTLGFVGPGAAGNYTGIYLNNINADPLFEGGGIHPYAITESSPAVDAGRPDTSGLNLPQFDFVGNPRIDNGIVDIGAYEYPSEIPVELVSFTINISGNSLTLNWTTASELNNAGFDIERSVISNGVRNLVWEKIGYVEGNGTTTKQNHYSFMDKVLSQEKYQYRLKQIDFDGTFEYSQIIEVDIFTVNEFVLNQNYPNPFNPSTNISWQVPVGSWQTLKVYDLLGREVATLVDEFKPAGSYEVNFDASQLSSGVYFYTLETDNNSVTKKLILLR
ncbi:MAG TPA: T9SS type A sorting domain-containing protein [Ignavibacteriaceae bacterium]|nr:T9SS type A sorting domain-containing protein [Ignavibacteriaceae bacterium]